MGNPRGLLNVRQLLFLYAGKLGWDQALTHTFSLSALKLYNFFGRFIKILDSVLHHLVPAWDYTLGTFGQLKVKLGLPDHY